MKSDDLKECLAEFGWSQAKFARIIQTHPNTVSKWMTGQARIPGAVKAYLELARGIRALQVT